MNTPSSAKTISCRSTRRALLLAIASFAAAPAVFAQQPTIFRIAWLSNDRGIGGSPFFDAFRQGLRDLGYVEGRSITIDARWGANSTERLAQLVAEVVQSNPQLIVTQGPAVLRVRDSGTTIPVVFGFSGDPVEARLVDSLARPGRNFTGVSYLSLELVGKRLELLKEAMPSLRRVAILANPQHAGEKSELRASQAAAKSLGIALEYFVVQGAAGVKNALDAIPGTRSEAIFVFPDATMMRYSEEIAAFATKHRMPAISGWSRFADGGNLMTYGPNQASSFRRLGVFVDKILKGARPADIPVELPTTVELVVNLKAAKALGVTIPQSILVRADRVIE